MTAPHLPMSLLTPGASVLALAAVGLGPPTSAMPAVGALPATSVLPADVPDLVLPAADSPSPTAPELKDLGTIAAAEGLPLDEVVARYACSRRSPEPSNGCARPIRSVSPPPP